MIDNIEELKRGIKGVKGFCLVNEEGEYLEKENLEIEFPELLFKVWSTGLKIKNVLKLPTLVVSLYRTPEYNFVIIKTSNGYICFKMEDHISTLNLLERIEELF